MYDIIGLVGRAHAGKDLVATHVHDTYGHDNCKFAGPMKTALKSLFDFSHEQVEGDLKETVDERWGVTPRRVMQFFGTEMLQIKMQELIPGLGRHFAVKRMFLNYDTREQPFCVSDVRFQHEVDAIRQHGGIVIRLRRNQDGHSKEHEHESESGVDGMSCDYDVDNDGSVADLFSKIDRILANKE